MQSSGSLALGVDISPDHLLQNGGMNDNQFPSGPWTGFYTYEPKDKHRMDLQMTFANGQIVGEGHDDLGPFVIKGRYDAVARECHWTKSYVGAHEVYYQGYREGKGIWGRWEINAFAHGGFHIWPKSASDGELQATVVRRQRPVKLLPHKTIASKKNP